jgi:hypothetical protein
MKKTWKTIILVALMALGAGTVAACYGDGRGICIPTSC